MTRRFRVVLAVLFLSLTSLILARSTPVFAANFDMEVTSSVTVASDGTTGVSHIFNVTNNVSSETFNKYSVPLMGTEATDVTAKLEDGEEITAVVSSDGRNVELEIPDMSGEGNQWSFSVEYKSRGLVQLGGASAIQIPPLTSGEPGITKQTLVVTADLDLGFATVIGPEAADTKVGLGDQTLTFNLEGNQIDKSVALVFGEQAVMEATVEAKLTNPSFWFQTKTLTLPPDTNQQMVFVNSISPQPNSVRLDADGNILVEYRLWPKQSINVNAKVTVGTKAVTYDDLALEGKDAIDQVIKDRYTSTTDDWKPVDDINVEESDSVLETVEAVNQAVADKVVRSELTNEFGPDTREGALKYADMEVGELRSMGIPARLVIGKSISNGAQLLDTPMDHAWVEAYVPGIGWMTVDPVFTNYTGVFGATDIFHLGMALWGVEDDFPPVPLDETKYTYVTTEFPESEDPGSVSATKFVLLPGISVFSVGASVPAGRIIDDMGVRADGIQKTFRLGSLAPFQLAKGRTFVFGGAAFSKEHVTFGIVDDGGEVIAEYAAGETTTSYLPLIALVAIILLTLFFIIWRKRKAKKADRKPSQMNQVMSHDDPGKDIESENLLPDDEPPVEEPEPPRKPTSQQPIHLTGTDALSNDATMNSDGSSGAAKAKPRPKKPRLIQ